MLDIFHIAKFQHLLNYKTDFLIIATYIKINIPKNPFNNDWLWLSFHGGSYTFWKVVKE
jgi:hypothetical protein